MTIVMLSALLLLVSAVTGIQTSWTPNGQNAYWDNPDNWFPSVPTINDTVVIASNAQALATVVIRFPASAQSVLLGTPGAPPTLTAALLVNSNLTVADLFQVGAPSTYVEVNCGANRVDIGRFVHSGGANLTLLSGVVSGTFVGGENALAVLQSATLDKFTYNTIGTVLLSSGASVYMRSRSVINASVMHATLAAVFAADESSSLLVADTLNVSGSMTVEVLVDMNVVDVQGSIAFAALGRSSIASLVVPSGANASFLELQEATIGLSAGSGVIMLSGGATTVMLTGSFGGQVQCGGPVKVQSSNGAQIAQLSLVGGSVAAVGSLETQTLIASQGTLTGGGPIVTQELDIGNATISGVNVTVSTVLTLSGTEVQLPNSAITLAQGASLNVSSVTIMTGGELDCADAAVLIGATLALVDMKMTATGAPVVSASLFMTNSVLIATQLRFPVESSLISGHNATLLVGEIVSVYNISVKTSVDSVQCNSPCGPVTIDDNTSFTVQVA